MEYLYAPWRDSYVTQGSPTENCVFCLQAQTTDDARHHIIQRHNHCFIMLNLFPYNAGHVMVIPYKHTAVLYELNPEELHEIMEVVTLSTKILKQFLKADGFNIGANLGGKAAGGSIADHLHMHVIPRWHGDTSFLTTTGEIKPISVDLEGMYKNLYQAFRG